MTLDMTSPALGFEIAFADLYHRDGLDRVDAAFVATLPPDLADRLAAARAAAGGADESALLVEMAPALDDFIGALFGVRAPLAELRGRHDAPSAPPNACSFSAAP